MVTVFVLSRYLAAISVGVALSIAPALASTLPASAAAQASFQREMAVCNSGKSTQDAGTCRKEARNARAEALRGGLKDDPGQYRLNAPRRCEGQKGEDKTDCEMRMNGQGNVDGSVGEGGVLRSSITIKPVK